MTPIINISELENEFFSVNKTNEQKSVIHFVDYNNQTQPSTSIYPASIGVNIYNKSITLNNLYISTNTTNISQEQLNNHVKNIINVKLFEEFIPKLYNLAEKHRKYSNINRLDISIRKLKNKYANDVDINNKIIRNIYSKITSSCIYIATQGRIGPGSFIIFNNNVSNKIYRIISETNDSMLHNKIYPYVTDLIKSDVIILGRKNKIDQPGIHAIILTDDKGNIEFKQIDTPHGNKYVCHFVIEECGFTPETQYIMIDTKDISDYRREKINKINESINE